MGKNDFLEILEDYLKNNLPEDRIQKIIQDYEEYFYNCSQSGIKEDKAVMSLGSPKGIAEEFLRDAADKEDSSKTDHSTRVSETSEARLSNKIEFIRFNKPLKQLKLFNKLLLLLVFIISLLSFLTVSILGILIVFEFNTLILSIQKYIEIISLVNYTKPIMILGFIGIIVFIILLSRTYILLIKKIVAMLKKIIEIIVENKKFIIEKETNKADKLN